MNEDDLRRETVDLALCAELHGAATLPSRFHHQGLERQAEMAAWIVLRLLRSAERGDKPALRFWRHRNRPPHLPRARRPSRNGHKPRIALLTPSLQMGGAERWVLDLARHLDRARVEVCGIGTYIEAHDKLFLDRAMRETTVFVGKPACNELVQGADAVICWGIRELPVNSPEVSIYVSHGSGIFPRLARQMAVSQRCHLTAVSRTAALPFPTGAKVTIIHNGIDAARCREREGRVATRRKWKLDPAEKAIGYVGRITQQKNASAAALAAATGRGPYRAVYVGTGQKEFLDVVRNFPGRPIIQDRVEQIGDVYRALDCFVLASPSEGFSLSLTEAWFCGCPTVATPVGAVPELEEQFGQLTCRVPVDPSGHQLVEAVKLAMSPENRQTVQRAQAVVRDHFTVERMARRWTDFVLELLEKEAGTSCRQETCQCHD